jgi:hypothetical protein
VTPQEHLDVVNMELTVGQLRRIVRTAPDDATLAEGLEELAHADFQPKSSTDEKERAATSATKL